MKIPIDKKRYRNRIIFLVLSTLVFGTGGILILVMNEGLSLGGILFVSFLGLLALISTFNTLFYFSISKLEYGFVYENGELYDYSKPFSKARGVKTEDIKSITNWSERMGINQYILVKKGFGLGGNTSVHRLKGNHIYLSDYVVNPEELKKLIQLIESEKEINEKKDELD